MMPSERDFREAWALCKDAYKDAMALRANPAFRITRWKLIKAEQENLRKMTGQDVLLLGGLVVDASNLGGAEAKAACSSARRSETRATAHAPDRYSTMHAATRRAVEG